MADLASFGGITRIRFKGFDRRFAPIISARRLPRTQFSVRIRLAQAKSICQPWACGPVSLNRYSFF
jgi:hypothetical protein